MKYKFNPLTWEFNIVPDSGTLKQKLNWLTGEFNLTVEADRYTQKFNPIEWEFNLWVESLIKKVTGNWYIDVTDAVAWQIVALRLYWWLEQRDIPSEYTQLDYITLNKCFFDTWITPTTDTDYELKFTIAQANITQWAMWMLNNSTPTNNFYFMVSSWNKFLSALWTSAITLQWLSDAVVDTDYIAKVNWETLTVNGVAATNFNRWTLEATQTINLWCRKNSENNWLTWKLYYFKIWKWWVLVAHYIPCKRNSDNVLWYYDIVNDTFGVLLTSYWTPVAWTNATPSPSLPINLVCNNWALKARHQSWLPLGYKKLLSIYNNTSATLDTGIKLASTDRVETRFFNSSASSYWAWYWIYATWESSAFYANWTYYWYDAANNKINTWVSIDTNWHDLVHDFVNWKLTLDWTDTSFTPFEFENTVNNKLFCRYYNWSYWYNVKWRITYYKVYRNDVLILDLIPCTRESDNTVWMYDMVSWTFIWPDEWYTFEEWTVATDPIVLYTDWLVETIEDELNNTATAEILLAIWDYVDEQEILSWDITRKVGIKVLDGTEEGWIKTEQYTNLYEISLKNDWAMSGDIRFPLISTHFVGTDASNSNMPDNSVKLTTRWVDRTNPLMFIKTSQGNNTLVGFTTWLANQYAAWTPVIAIYPLDTSATETVEWQPLELVDWDNHIEIIEASIDNLPLELEYNAQ